MPKRTTVAFWNRRSRGTFVDFTTIFGMILHTTLIGPLLEQVGACHPLASLDDACRSFFGWRYLAVHSGASLEALMTLAAEQTALTADQSIRPITGAPLAAVIPLALTAHGGPRLEMNIQA
jgi:hypothetical protein